MWVCASAQACGLPVEELVQEIARMLTDYWGFESAGGY